MDNKRVVPVGGSVLETAAAVAADEFASGRRNTEASDARVDEYLKQLQIDSRRKKTATTASSAHCQDMCSHDIKEPEDITGESGTGTSISEDQRERKFTDHSFSLVKPVRSTCRKDIDEAIPTIHETSRPEVPDCSYKASSIPKFSSTQIKGATHDDLNPSAKIGGGRLWTVYEGTLDGTKVAIKKLACNTEQGQSDFVREVEFLQSGLTHPNLVKLLGACFEARALVYEFLPNGSLEDYLSEKRRPGLLTWQIRTRIIYQICSALIFLHSSNPNPVVHGNLKPSNILLDNDYNCKLANFGLAHFLPPSKSTDDAYRKTVPRGTYGYIDPEFVATGELRSSSDVYSFGVTVLRILTGLSALAIDGKVLRVYGPEESEEAVMSMVDRTAGPWPLGVAMKLARFGLKCCDETERSSRLMEEFSTELKSILAKIY